MTICWTGPRGDSKGDHGGTSSFKSLPPVTPQMQCQTVALCNVCACQYSIFVVHFLMLILNSTLF